MKSEAPPEPWVSAQGSPGASLLGGGGPLLATEAGKTSEGISPLWSSGVWFFLFSCLFQLLLSRLAQQLLWRSGETQADLGIHRLILNFLFILQS